MDIITGYIRYIHTKLNFTLQISDDFNLNASNGILVAKNSFNMSFLHDFSISSTSDNKIEVIKKYNKRINTIDLRNYKSQNHIKIFF